MTKKDLILEVQEVLKIYAYKDIAYIVNIAFDSMVDALRRKENFLFSRLEKNCD